MNFLIVGSGGFIGAGLRYLMSRYIIIQYRGFNLTTVVINIIGSFFIGLISAYAMKNGIADSKLILMLKVGVCGGFTTFSTFSLESLNLFQASRPVELALNIILSVFMCIGAVYLGELAIMR